MKAQFHSQTIVKQALFAKLIEKEVFWYVFTEMQSTIS